MTELTAIKPKKILIRSTNWIGDAIMTTPAVRTIRQNFPEAHIAVLVHPWVADVFSASPHVDEIIPYYKKTTHLGIKGIWQLGRELSTHNFDVAILLQNAFEAALIAKIAGIPVRAGYKRDCRGLLLTHPVSIPAARRKVHQVHYYQDLLQDLGLTKGADNLFLSLSDEDSNWAQDYLGKNKVTGAVIGLNPGAAYGPAKRWPAEKYGELAQQVEKKLGASILVFGTKDDQKAAAVIQSWCDKKTVDLTGKTTLSQAMALIAKCDSFITNDSGLMHVAAALQTPLVAIFGSTDHVATGPYSDNSVIVRKEISCSPCLKTHCKTNFECMDTIEAGEVFSHVCQMVDK